MARFVAMDDLMGFDGENLLMPWQMVPLGATRVTKPPVTTPDGKTVEVDAASSGGGLSRSVKLTEASDDVSVVVSSKTAPANGLVFFTGRRISATERVVVLHGNAAGSYVVEAVDSKNKSLARLDVDVVKPRNVKIAYYWLPGAQSWDTSALNDAASKILSNGANVTLEWLEGIQDGFEKLVFPAGPMNLNNKDTRVALTEYGNNKDSALNVYLTGFAVDDANGMTLGQMTIIDGLRWNKDREFNNMASTLAHEVGHFLSSKNGPSHDPRKEHLMFHESPHGIRIPKARVLQFIRD